LQKARALLPATTREPEKQKPQHKTLNGTVVTAPHLLLPRKKITKAAEKDIDRVVAGKLSMRDWAKKHKYSESLLRKRLEMRGVKDPHARKRDGYNLVPGYTPPSEKLSEADIKRALAGEIGVARLAKEVGIPTGTVYRLIADYQKKNPITSRQPGSLSPRGITVSDADLQAVVDGKLSAAELGRRHGVVPQTISYHVKKYCARFGVEWPSKNEELELFEEGDEDESEGGDEDAQQAADDHPRTPPILDELKNLASEG
jgi:transposase-like protein